MMKKLIAVYPGTFDPITNGHLDIIVRSAGLFDEVIVAVAKSENKKPMFTKDERAEMVKKVTAGLKNVKVDSFSGLLVRYAAAKKAKVIVRGLRAISDFDYEFQMSLTNRKLNPGVTTIFLMPNEKYSYLNSSLVRELALLDANIKEFLPDYVFKKLKEKLR